MDERIDVDESTPLNAPLLAQSEKPDRWKKILGLTTLLILCLFLVLSVNAPRETAEGSTRTVIVLRHCARSTPLTIDGGAQGFRFLDNYTDTPVPQWPVPEYQCLPKGLTLVTALARSIADALPSPVIVIADSAQRDIDTAKAFLSGLGMSQSKYSVAPSIFDPEHNQVCTPLGPKQVENELKARWKEDPPPLHHRAALKALQKVLGDGAAPGLGDIDDVVKGFYYGGGSYVAASFAEVFEMQLGGGYTVAWDRLSEGEVYDIMKLRVYYRSVEAR